MPLPHVKQAVSASNPQEWCMLEQGESSGDDRACDPLPPSAASEAGGSGEALTL
jgi:hypothetical protein